jgi:integrase
MKGGDVCVIGGIYSKEKCPICKKNFRDTGKGMTCPNHPEFRSDKGIYVKFKGISKRFDGDYAGATRFVTGLRFKTDEGTFDRRDYENMKPLGFEFLIEKWLGYKRDEVSDYRHLCHFAWVASDYFKDKNIKTIGAAELEDFAKSIKAGQKTRKNYMTAIHHFYVWCKRRKYITEIPEFPVIKFKLGYRKVIGKETQSSILEEIRRISPPKVYLAIKFLSTYINVRPKEMRSLQEGNIDLENGYLTFPNPKDKDYKVAPLIEEDIEILKTFPTAIDPEMLFFRKDDGTGFGPQYLWLHWQRSCKNLGIQGVDLYGGTRHSSARALRQQFSPERIKRALGSATNVAFERYFNIEQDEVREVFSQASSEKVRNICPTLKSSQRSVKP